MTRQEPRKIGILILLAYSLCFTCLDARAYCSEDRFRIDNNHSNQQPMFLWAWDRPENLSFIDPRQVGVAFLAKTIYLGRNEISIRPRVQPLQVPRGTMLTAVVRLESKHSGPVKISKERIKQVTDSIAELSRLSGISGIQLDFDATLSERSFYRALISEIRHKLPPDFFFSITALASWCLYDSWISDLPINDAIPMLFRMGPDRGWVRRYLAEGQNFLPSVCRHSVGISVDELINGQATSGKTVYVFSPRAWTEASFKEITKGVKLWDQ